MLKIENHPILEIPIPGKVTFLFEDKFITSDNGITLAAALHRAGYPVHSHSLENRERSLQCGIGKCGACEMIVDGKVRRICNTKVDGISEVREIPRDYLSEIRESDIQKTVNIYKTTVAIIGAGPAGLACREELLKKGIDNIVIDNNERIGGQFIMQTH
ncbi:MAG: 2Fe-2S iron-sulfur cluster-binding protein, partial [Paludibacter sp.]